MDGSCEKNLTQVLLKLFTVVVAACGSTLLAQDNSRLGLLPALLPSPRTHLASSDTFMTRLRAVVQRKLQAALAVEPNLALVPFNAQTSNLPSALEHFPADSVRLFCQNHRLEKLLSPSLESMSASSNATQQHRVFLRWLDAASGEMTKFQIIEFESTTQDTAFAGFDAHTAVRALLDAPELILSQEQQAVALLPALRDLSAVASPPRSRRWLWLVSAAVVLGGGSAYLLMQEPQSERTKRFLPEPPGPPPQ